MTKTRVWPVRAMYMLIAAALVISLIITLGPVPGVASAPSEVKAEWSRVSTPSKVGWVLTPGANIVDYAVADVGEVAYAIVETAQGPDTPPKDWAPWYLLKSTDHAATWKDITGAVEKVLGDDDEIRELVKVATDGVDPDFVAVALRVYWDDDAAVKLNVFISSDGGTTFRNTGAVVLTAVYDFAVSHEAAGVRDIAIAGRDGAAARIYRYETVMGGGWVNATAYAGWFTPAAAVVAVRFAPSWAADKTVLAVSVTGTAAYLQSGTWGTLKGWNQEADFKPAVELRDVLRNAVPATIPYLDIGGFTASIATPTDYAGRYANQRYVWVHLNYRDAAGDEAGKIFRIRDGSVSAVLIQIPDSPWLSNVCYLGNIAGGKSIAGLLGDGTGAFAGCCLGVQVYRNDTIADMEICCIGWREACKPPTGRLGMEAFYVSADKAYAVALGGEAYDEGAWSVSYDDGYIWNQTSLIDTYINYLSDVAVSPNCNKTMAVSINVAHGCGCDSVWYRANELTYAPEYSGKWLRTWCGELGDEQYGLLRLNPDEVNGETVYLVDRGTYNVYYNGMQTMGCWEPGRSNIDEIVDLAVKNESTIYALGSDGKVAMSDDFGVAPSWTTAVASKVDDGWTIALWGDHVLVGGQDGDVSHSDSGGANFTALKDVAAGGVVTVAFDSYFDANGAIYAALAGAGAQNGVYLWVAGESTVWTTLGAEPYDYTGLVLDRPAPGNPKTSPATGGVLYASYVTSIGGQLVTGVARALTPVVEILCEECIEWDYLTQGLAPDGEAFYYMPNALKICGCLTADSDSKLFAIDGLDAYDMEKGRDGSVWHFEDCYAKRGPTLNAPADGFVVPADACECRNAPFTTEWTRLCDACVYEIRIATDPNFENEVWGPRRVAELSSAANPSLLVGALDELQPGVTYYWSVRAIEAGTGQEIRSWWSEARTFTVAPFAGTGVHLVAPEIGATGVPRTNIAFVWDSIAPADEFDWELTNDAGFTSTVATAAGLTATAHTYTGTALAYDSPYYWRVTAIKDGVPISQATGTFRTVAETPVEPEPEPLPTPFWVWVVIAIGAILVIVVIVLIFRTRRV